jgi:filamentous hemagglutinin family protein
MKHLKHPFWISSIALSFWANLTTASAQIVPDNTLPVNSQVTGCPVCLIEGGTVRGVNLFHSFEEFSVQTGGEAFFNNALDIENIFSRVTGANISGIDGWIRANSTANLFLINPNGIIFGENARLDVGGSFVASTANSFTFPDGSEFSATNPQAPPLLTINITPGLQYGANSPGGTIANAGKLTAGQDLTLAADNLDLQGQLSAGRDLTLKAQDTVTIRDSLTHPFIASAEGNLLVQGNQTIDIFALNHPDSGLFSGGDMVLRSASPVWGDAHYWSGGNFRIEQLDGNLGDLASPEDPVIRALGDVLLNRYTGASLHIFAGGWVAIGTVTITATDPTEGIRENVTLSDGTVLAIDGKVQPTLDVRAGLDPNAVGSPIGLTGNNFFDIGGNFDDIPDSADIAIGEVFVDAANGVVFLTNQYQPNPSLSGDIEVGSILTNDFIFTGNAGSVIIDSRGDINITNQIDSSSTSGNAGNITLIANDVVSLTGSFIVSATDGVGTGGDTRIQSGSVLLKEGAVVSTATLGAGDAGNLTVETGELLVRDGSQLIVSTFGTGNGGELNVNATGTVAVADGIIRNNVEAGATGSGGDIKITASSVSMTTGAVISASTLGEGDAGQVVILATDSILLDGEDSQGFSSSVFSTVASGAKGNSGGVDIESGSLTLNNGTRIVAITLGEGDAGSVVIRATDSILLDGEDSQGLVSGIVNTVALGAKGNSGGVEIESGSLTLNNGAVISTTTFGEGDAGQVVIRATDSIVLDGENTQGFNSGVFSTVALGAQGNSGGVDIESQSLTLNNGAVISTNTFGEGDAGQVVIRATDSIVLDGENSQGFGSGVLSAVESGAKGNSGGVEIESGSLTLNNGAGISASTWGEGDAGSVVIRATDSIVLDGEDSQGFNSGVFSTVESGAQGNSGGVEIESGSLTLNNGAVISTNTLGEGDAGSVVIRATDTILLDGENSQGFFSSVFSAVESGAQGNSGGVNIESGSLTLNNGAVISASTLGEGDAGLVVIRATDSIILDGQNSQGFVRGVFSTVESGAQGNSGGVEIETQSLTLNNGAVISASTWGEGDAGQVVIRATDSIVLDGENSQGLGIGVFSIVESGAKGNSGGVEIETQSLTLNNGAGIYTSTLGEGDAGQVVIRAVDSIILDGENSQGLGSGVLSTVESGAKGNSGGVEIESQSLTLNNGAIISASTLGEGDAGKVVIMAKDSILLNGENSQGFVSIISSIVASGAKGNSGGVEISTRSLTVNNGAGISAETNQTGTAGSLSINATESVDLNGVGGLSVEATQGGIAGNLTVNTGRMAIRDGAIVTVSSPSGQAGNLTIQANSLQLDQGQLTAETGISGVEGGANISLQNLDTLIMTNESLISAKASGDANGGNIDIESIFLLVLPPEGINGSDIIASAQRGDGGRITITGEGIFGIGERPAIPGNRTNDIDASSQFGNPGQVIRNVSLDPSRGLTQLPSTLVDPSGQINRTCAASNRQSQFTVTGRGGLPENPTDLFSPDLVQDDFGTVIPREEDEEIEGQAEGKNDLINHPPKQIIEAQGWIIDEEGNVILTAYAPDGKPHGGWQNSVNCQVSETASP